MSKLRKKCVVVIMHSDVTSIFRILTTRCCCKNHSWTTFSVEEQTFPISSPLRLWRNGRTKKTIDASAVLCDSVSRSRNDTTSVINWPMITRMAEVITAIASSIEFILAMSVLSFLTPWRYSDDVVRSNWNSHVAQHQLLGNEFNMPPK